MNGIVIIDKPQGWTSQDVTARLRRVFNTRRIGHGGTLDPMATGVLPVFVGRGTRGVEFFEHAEKVYETVLRLGVTTDTEDITGTVLTQQEVSISEEDILGILPQFRGEIQQIPPMYSALKVDGKKLYDLARKGIEVERKPRPITIHELTLLPQDNEERLGPLTEGAVMGADEVGTHDWGSVPKDRQHSPRHGFAVTPPSLRGAGAASIHDIRLRVHCSKGTYIRTLCKDIGDALGCGGCMAALRRVRAGEYTVDEAVPLETLLECDNPEQYLRPVDSMFRNFPAVTLSEKQELRCRNGNSFSVSMPPGTYRVYGKSGEFLALSKVEDGVMSTVKSFFEI